MPARSRSSPDDRFVATTWWTAHVAARAPASHGGDRFLYLIQEHEPFTFPMGSLAALADGVLRPPARGAVLDRAAARASSADRGLGVFAGGAEAGDAGSADVPERDHAVEPPAAAELAARRPRRLLFYARPEPHAARNMFELGMLGAAAGAAERGAFADGWTLHGIGTAGGASGGSTLGGGATLELLPRAAQAGTASCCASTTSASR